MTRWFQIVRLRIRSLLRGSDVDRDLNRELQSHISQQIDEHLAAGLTPAEARRTALRQFGGLAGVSEACRDTRRVTPFQNALRDLRYAGRTLLRHPVLLLVGSLSIALGVGANLTIFSLANNLLLAAPTAFRPDRLVHIRTGNGSHVSYRGWRGLSESGALAGIAGYSIEEGVNWRHGNASVTIMPLVVTANFFDVVGVPMQEGRAFTAGEAAAERDPRFVVLSDGFWRRQLNGDTNVIGRTLVLNGLPYTVAGVLAGGVRSLPGYGLSPEIYLPLSRTLVPEIDNPDAVVVQLIGRLQEGQTVDAGRAAVSVALQRAARDAGDSELQVLTVFSPVGGLSQVKEFKEIGAFFVALQVVTLLVLAIACANVAGLLLARGTARRREIAMRVALGATRSRLVQQLLTEGFVLALLGAIGGVALTALLALFIGRVPLPLPLPVDLRLAFDVRLAGLALALVLLSTLLTALTPALQTTRPSLVPSLKQEAAYAHRRLSLRSLLVVGQVAVTALLLVAAVVFLRNLTMAHSLDPGFDTDAAVVARVAFVEGRQGTTDAFAVENIVERVRALPGVQTAAFTEGVPLTLFSGSHVGTRIRLEGERPVHIEYHANRVGPAYFAAMRIPLLRGRDFESADRAGAVAVAIINKEFADRYFAGRDPVGLHLEWEERQGTAPTEIVGVVANAKYRSIGEARSPAVYTPYLQHRTAERQVHVITRTLAPPDTLVDDVRQAILQTDPSAAVTIQPMSAALAFAFLPSRIGALLFGALGMLGCALAMVGLYGVVSFTVGRRTVEFGIRMALGASHGSIVRMVLKESTVLVGAGLALGLAAAVLLVQPLAAFLVAGLQPGDPLHLAAAAVLILAVSLGASWSPVRRAIQIQPATALRTE
jgi:predicted permease